MTKKLYKIKKILQLYPCILNNGENNNIEIDKNTKCDLKINGSNNFIKIENKVGNKLKLKINICGNNNKIHIKELNKIPSNRLNIDIGNYTGCENVNITIGENCVFNGVKIYAYQSNVPISIGNGCLFSSDIVIRSGELPHIIYDITTKEDIDKSDGIDIGNHVWIGEGSYIMKNVTIPNNSIVGSKSVVTKRFEQDNIVIAGNPAKMCKKNINWAFGKEYFNEQIKD